MSLSDEEGKLAVEIARKTLDLAIREGRRYEPKRRLPAAFKEDRGVFVTLSSYPGHKLRGCIGFTEPVAPLIEALIDSAISAATRDPRFPPVEENELLRLVVEVSVLAPPKKIEVNNPGEYPKKIKVGRDGLIVRKGGSLGLLLPQVPVEWGWDEEEFLSQTCNKAGLPLSAWLDEDIEILKFQGQIWQEEDPKGKVIRKNS